MSSIVNYFGDLGRSIINRLLPTNKLTQKIAELDLEIKKLEKSLNDKTSDVFHKKVQEMINLLASEKQKCETELLQLNGAYYEDPKSLLKKAWDELVERVQIALGIHVNDRSQLDQVLLDLNTLHPDARQEAIQAISTYLKLEKKRDGLQEKLEQIIASQKTGSLPLQEIFLREKQKLENRHIELCGHYFKDPNGLLDQTWSKYVQAQTNGSSEAPSLLEQFNQLEEERKQTEGKLFIVNQHLNVSAAAERSYLRLAENAFQEKIDALNQLKIDKFSQSGADWKKTQQLCMKTLSTNTAE